MLFLVALLPIVAAAAVPLTSQLAGAPSRRLLMVVAMVGLGLTLLLALLAAAGGWTGTIVWSGPLRLTAVLTPIAGAMAMLVPVIALPILAYAAFHEDETGLGRLVAILLLFVAGMELLVIADDLLTLLIGWELVGACSYLLIAHDWRHADNAASGLYAFLMTRFGDLGLFAAAMAAYAATGSFSYDGLSNISGPLAAIVAFGLLLSAASKSGQVPFSPWLFRAMAGPTSVSALLHAATMVAAGAYILIRLEPFLATVPGVPETIVAIGLATALSGGLVATLQNHAKKLLAASTSAHYGLMFVAVGSGYPGIAFLHLVAHAAFKALLFLAAGIAGERAGSYGQHLMGFGRALPLVATMTAISALSLAGIPPLGGAWTKEAIVTAAEHGSVWIAAGVILAGGLSAAYATRFQLSAFGLVERQEQDSPKAKPGRVETGAVVALALLTLATSLVWVPSVREATGRVLEIELLEASLATFILSTAAVAAGLLVGVFLVRRFPEIGVEGRSAETADWLGLPDLIERTITRPVTRLAVAAAAVDDRVIDAGVRLIANSGARAARLGGRKDDRVLDRGVTASASAVTWLASASDRTGEWLIDGLAEGTALIVGQSGRDARRLQTGMSHHYYALATGGAILAFLFLLIVS
ncbi:NADH-quinone oxidoreductase subunit L [Aurantimonas sp. C2-6-R+9]|uniref:NADH-quinone oxidoreductase subunit 5 family protein n=1 Tax=unclassified Aurantimonas TaxID=2638230 RepID=UPI002E17519B|nr:MULTISPECIES: NADH-quinone oxidoreductase subunit L [unclassified Aurantimonas]MEC5289905.1 NADH-quinone oxidoreductase subunit L [Aurantimonas sp. C2-3-R2]MEC5379955.1 NADH-quinone oxidoreductase subunit L [Aurantimonas sp. C2-6-R+9]MEC5410987.1 NADH-quinone oxidoreductase subunit L [Aurantimonas sp. C2-4-R8]